MSATVFNHPIRRVGIFCKPQAALGQETLTRLTRWLEQKGCEISMTRATADLLGSSSFHPAEDIPQRSDLIIVLGGDGTLLATAHITHPAQVPILAVNLGSLGFMTEVSLPQLYPTLEQVFRGESTIESRILLKTQVIQNGTGATPSFVLNEVAFNRGTLASIINLEVHVNGQYMTSYRADGLIISTPTGSTAYSLSAGGPILHPRLSALVLCPICPFTLTNRPIVIPSPAVIQVRQTTKEEVRVTLDGQTGYDMRGDDVLEMSPDDRPLLLIQATGKNYYQILRQKLHWGRPADDQKIQ